MAQKKKDQAPKADHTPLADKADLSEQLTMDFSAEAEPPKKPARKRTTTKKKEEPAQGVDATAAKEAPAAEKPVRKRTAPKKEPDAVEKEAPLAAGALSAPKQSLPTVSAGNAVQTALPHIALPQEQRRRFWGRVLFLLILTAVVAASVLIFLYRPSSYSERTRSVQFFYIEAENNTVVVINGVERGRVVGQLVDSSYDRTGRVYAALIGDRLYVIRGNDVEELGSSVCDFVLASDGTALAFRTQDTALYHARIGKKDAISKITPATPNANYVLSPDGKELFYTYVYNDQIRVDVHSRSGQKPELANTVGFAPLAISDDSKYLYYTDAEGTIWLYCRKDKDNPLRKCGTYPADGDVLFNADFSQILFYDATGMRLYSKGERIQFTELGAEQSLTLLANHRVNVRELAGARQYMMQSFLKNYYLKSAASGKQMLLYMDRKGALTDVSFVDAADTVTVTDKAVYFLLTDDGDTEQHSGLYSVRAGKTQKERICWDVASYCANVDGSRVLYVDYHNALFAKRIGRVETPISDAVVSGSLRVTANDLFCYYRTDGELYYSDNGDEPRKAADGVRGFYIDGNTVYYFKDVGEDRFDVYTNYRNKRTDTRLFEGIAVE